MQEAKEVHPRYSNVLKVKAEGATYTPKIFADFVAKHMLEAAEIPGKGSIRILDPACGDGELLDALISSLSPTARERAVVHGFDTDLEALQSASNRLKSKFPTLKLTLEKKNFLELILETDRNNDLLSSEKVIEPFDLIISNPPYVRTQILGAQQSRELAKNFNLRGRVDLYYPFILGISKVLKVDGITGVITSNRFMTTKSGRDVREQMLKRFELISIWDLGDTKLFEAAVLPSVFLAKGVSPKNPQIKKTIKFSSIYETKLQPQVASENVLDALIQTDDTIVSVPDGRAFKVRHGLLDNGGEANGVWRIATQETDRWLSTVLANTWDTFSRIGKIRVGVKSTADKVFIRSDWNDLPSGRPELLKALITRKCARRFRGKTPENAKHRKEILYPHICENGVRTVIDIDKYPKSAEYLNLHRERLEKRKYLIDAGRKWYELWVPQDPGAWKKPKLVFPDISEKPVFWMDTEGGIVNGECYWLQPKDTSDEDLLWLAIAVGNSSFIEVFYDHRFNNKLYAGKRRFITQYVEKFPLPDPTSTQAQQLIDLSKEIHRLTPSDEAQTLIEELDLKVWQIFGLEREEITG